MFKNKSESLFLLCFLAYFSAYVGRSAFSAALPEIIATTSWDKSILGMTGSMFFFSYGIGQLVNGILGDKLNPKKMILIGLLLSSVSNLIVGISPNPYILCGVWFLNGFCLSMVWSPIIKLFSVYLDDREKALAATKISYTIPAGTILSFLLTAGLIAISGWRLAFIGSAVVVFAISLIWMFSIEKATEGVTPHIVERKKAEKTKGFKISKELLIVLILMVILTMSHAVIKDGVTMWVPTYISEYFGLDTVASILSTAVLPIVNLSGVIVAQKAYLKLKSIVSSLFILFSITILSLILLYLFGKLSVVFAILFLSTSTSAMLGANSMIMGVFPMYFAKSGKTSTVTGSLNFCSYMSSAFSSFLIGIFSSAFGWDNTVLMWVFVAVLGVLACLAIKKAQNEYVF